MDCKSETVPAVSCGPHIPTGKWWCGRQIWLSERTDATAEENRVAHAEFVANMGSLIFDDPFSWQATDCMKRNRLAAVGLEWLLSHDEMVSHSLAASTVSTLRDILAVLKSESNI